MDEGSPIPDASVVGMDGSVIRLRDLDGPAVIYFYPKADTSGCTREAQDFSALADDFAAAGVHVLAVSRDMSEALAKFAGKYGLTVPLASDADGSVCDAFGVWGEKQMYGRTYMGIERATFLFDAGLKLARAWRKVRVPGHAQAVLDAARGA